MKNRKKFHNGPRQLQHDIEANTFTSNMLVDPPALTVDMIRKAAQMLRDNDQTPKHWIDHVKMTTANFQELRKGIAEAWKSEQGVGMLSRMGGIDVRIDENVPPEFLFQTYNRDGELLESVKA